MNDALAALEKSRNDLVTAIIERIKNRHSPHIAQHDERLVRDHETWLDAGYALRLLHPEPEPEVEGEA